ALFPAPRDEAVVGDDQLVIDRVQMLQHRRTRAGKLLRAGYVFIVLIRARAPNGHIIERQLRWVAEKGWDPLEALGPVLGDRSISLVFPDSVAHVRGIRAETVRAGLSERRAAMLVQALMEIITEASAGTGENREVVL